MESVATNSGLSSPPRDSEVWNTTLYKQFWSQKDRAPDALLFFRLGDFYELFGEDAIVAAPVMEVQLTSRDKKSDVPVPMCGVPVHAWTGYVEKLLSRGYKVALCEQLENPKDSNNKIVERGLVRILTPGLPVDFKHLPQKKKHFILSLSSSSGSQVKAVLHDFLSADFFSCELNSKTQLNDLLRRYDPAELLIANQADLKNEFWGLLDQSSTTVTSYSKGSADSLLKDYLRYTQCWSLEQLQEFWSEPLPLQMANSANQKVHAVLSQQVLEQWNVYPDLFEFLDQCGSVLGSRKLRDILAMPLCDVDLIKTRQATFKLLERPHELLKTTKLVNDVERLLGRFRVRAAQPRELIRFTLSLKAVYSTLSSQRENEGLWNKLYAEDSLPELKSSASFLADLLSDLETVLNLEVDSLRAQGLKDLIRPGADRKFDQLLEVFSGSQDWLSNYENTLRKETGIAKLKVRYNKVFGYFIEVSKAQSVNVPSSFERKQTMVNAERYATETLRDKEEEILSAEVNIEKRAEELLTALQNKVLCSDSKLKQTFASFAWIDALAGSVAGVQSAERYASWVVPEPSEGAFSFEIKEARHPLIESRLGSFVANSISLGGSKQPRILLLTGPNMAGKSTLMRQTGLCLLLAQCGFKVPAESMTFTPASSFYSRMGASDKILDGESTFMVEMKETAGILNESDDNSFILIDEIGRGTSTQDGLTIAQAVLESLHENSKALVVFATHYHELSEVAEGLSEAQNASMGIKEWEGELIFLRSLELQPASSSHGIHVAKMAGLPDSILSRAEELFANFKTQEQDSSQPKRKKSLPSDKFQMSLFEAAPVVTQAPQLESVESLKGLDINSLSPRDAWGLIEKIKSELQNSSKGS